MLHLQHFSSDFMISEFLRGLYDSCKDKSPVKFINLLTCFAWWGRFKHHLSTLNGSDAKLIIPPSKKSIQEFCKESKRRVRVKYPFENNTAY